MRHRHPLSRLHEIGRDGDLVAVERGDEIGLHHGVVGVAEGSEYLAPPGAIRTRPIGQLAAHRRCRPVAWRAPAVRVEEALVDPLRVGDASEDRVHVASEVGCGLAEAIGPVEPVLHRVEQSEDPLPDTGAPVGRRAHDVRRVRLQGLPVDADGRTHGAIARVVDPAVAAQPRERWGVRAGDRAAIGWHHDESAAAVSEDLAQIDVDAEEAASIQGLRRGGGALDHARRRAGDQCRAIRDVGVASTAVRWIGHVERLGRVVPDRLGVGDVHAPCDVRVSRGDLAQHATLRVVAVDAEASGLFGHGAGGILERPTRRHAGHLGSEVERLLAVAHPSEAHCRMDRHARYSRQIHLRGCRTCGGRRVRRGTHPRGDGHGTRDACGLKELATREQSHRSP